MDQHTVSDHMAKPLRGLVVADLGVGMAAALVAKFMAEAGAEVRRIEPLGGDPFYDIYPAYSAWRTALAGVEDASSESELRLLRRADVCIVGGEDLTDFSTRHDAEELSAHHPRMIALDIAAMLPGAQFEPLHGADILVQARSGLMFEHNPHRPTVLGFAPSAYGAALLSLIGLSAALYHRERSNRGQIVRAGLLEGSMIWAQPYWASAEHETPRFQFNIPRGARPLIFETRDGAHIHVVLGSAGAKYKLYKVLGINDPAIKPNDPGLPDPSAPPSHYFGDVERLAPYAARWDAKALMAALETEGVVCECVAEAQSLFDDPQTLFNGLVNRSAEGVESFGQPINWRNTPTRRASSFREPSLQAQAPLAGVKVIDFGAFVAGPASSVGLADLGADVIKVEPPHGDPLRTIYGFYAAANRGKRSISIEMKTEAGLRLAHELAQQADIVCTNFKIGVAERLGIDAATLHSTHPEKIVLNNAGYGLVGPQAANPAFDPCMQAKCGLEVRNGGAGNLPALSRLMMVDFCGALLGQIGTLMALYRRAVDGSGSAVTIPLLNAGLFLMSDTIRLNNKSLLGPPALLPDQTGHHPAEKLYRASDGWIAVAARTDTAARAFALALGLKVIAATPRQRWSAHEMESLERAIADMTAANAVNLFAAAQVPAEHCTTEGWRQYLADDNRLAEGQVYEATRPEFGKVRGLGRLYGLSSVLPQPRGTLSEKGQDTRAIIAEAGISDAEVEALYAAKVLH